MSAHRTSCRARHGPAIIANCDADHEGPCASEVVSSEEYSPRMKPLRSFRSIPRVPNELERIGRACHEHTTLLTERFVEVTQGLADIQKRNMELMGQIKALLERGAAAGSGGAA